MLRRDFIKGSLSSMALLSIPTLSLGDNISSVKKRFFIISNEFSSSEYLNVLKQKNISSNNILVLNKDKLNSLNMLNKLLEKQNNNLFCGILTNSDYALLEQATLTKKVKFLSEVYHTTTGEEIKHYENSNSLISLNQVFSEFKDLNSQNLISLYHSTNIGFSKDKNISKGFISKDNIQNNLVSFIFQA